MAELDFLTVGLVTDMYTEKSNDDVEYTREATQEDIDKLLS